MMYRTNPIDEILKMTAIFFYNELKGCEDGYFGPNCTSPCRYPNFGQRCQEECNCIERQCDASIGCKYIHGKLT